MHLSELQARYRSLKRDCDSMESILSKTPMTRSAEGVLITDLAPAAKRLHVRQQTGHGILLMIALALNAILQTHKPSNSDLSLLASEADNLVDQVIDLATQAMQYRPLAASATPICLIAAWAVTDDVFKQERLQGLLDEYQQDFASVRWRDQASGLKARLRGFTQASPNSESKLCILT